MSHRRTAESGSTALVSRGAFAIPEPALVVDRYGRTNLTQAAAVTEAHTRVIRAMIDNVRSRTELEGAFASYRRQQALIEFLDTLSPQEQAYYEVSLRSGR